ncbi:MAG: 30S ribosomal protein S17 [Acidobacteria bacterium]|nr:MAG: 30S ribosomal protein S17 [Acidobacteriota bacterium]
MSEQQERSGKPALRKTGLVVSEKMDKTVVVAVQRMVAHPRYKKRLRLTKRFLAHDEHSRCHVGDKVIIVETRPLSKRKRWRVCEILTSPTRVNQAEAKAS